MKLKKKMYYYFLLIIILGIILSHSALFIITGSLDESVKSLNYIYLFLIGLIYAILFLSVIDYYIFYRLKNIIKGISFIKKNNYICKKEIIDTAFGDEISDLTKEINLMVSHIEQQEKELKKKEKRYESLIEDNEVLIKRFEKNGEIVSLNDSCAKIYGEKKEEMMGKNIYKIIQETGIPDDQIKKCISSLNPSQPVFYSFCNLPNSNENKIALWINRGIFDNLGTLEECQSIGIELKD